MKFITSVSMPCTKEQYEADLKKPLKEMGYKIGSFMFWDCELNQYITNNFGLAGKLGNVGYKTAVSPYYHFIPTYNPEFFLALAAMTDAGGIMKWEWYVYNDYNEKELGVAPCNLYVTSIFRKATKEEIIKHFDMKKEEQTDLRELIQSGDIVELTGGDVGLVVDTPLGRFIQYDKEWGAFSDYNSELKISWNTEIDIIRIRRIDYGNQIIPRNFSYATIIWERKEMKEITIDELIEEAGYKKGEIKVKVEL